MYIPAMWCSRISAKSFIYTYSIPKLVLKQHHHYKLVSIGAITAREITPLGTIKENGIRAGIRR